MGPDGLARSHSILIGLIPRSLLRQIETSASHTPQLAAEKLIRRELIGSGDLQELVDPAVRGVTSNPSILEQAIAGSADNDRELRALVATGSVRGRDQ